MSAKPTFVFVPGAWHGPQGYDATASLLAKKGYESKYVHLASVGANPPLKDMSPDVEVIRKAVEEVLNAGKDVVLVMHSYAGIPAMNALEHIMDNNSGGNGRGRVVRLAWICGFVVPTGVSLFNAVGNKDTPWWKIEVCHLLIPFYSFAPLSSPHPRNHNLTSTSPQGDSVDADTPNEIFYNDLSTPVATSWANKLKPFSYRCFYGPATCEPWTKIPSSYLVCEKDNAIPVQGQDGMITNAKSKAAEVGFEAFDIVERLDASHSPFLSMPDRVAAYLERAAGGR